MKRKGALLLICAALLLSACGEAGSIPEFPAKAADQIQLISPEPEIKPAEIPEAAPGPSPGPTPSWEIGIASGYGIGVLYCKVNRGTVLEITGEDDLYYSVRYEGTELLAEKRLIRDASQTAPEEHKAYARQGAEIFDGPYLTGAPLESPRQNTELTVIDEFGDLMLVRTDKTEGYIRAASVSPVWISWTTDSEDRGSGNNGSSGAGIGGADGGDITLGNRMNEAALPVLLSSRHEEPETGSAVRPSDGVILADGTELYLGIVYPGDELMILSADDRTAEIYSSRGTGVLPRWAVLIGNEEPYSVWTGYSLYGAKMYGDYRMTGEYEEKALNTEMTVILETDNGFFIKLSDGRFGYMERSAVSRTKTVVYYNDSGSGSGDSAVEEWTVPVL